MYGCQSSAWPGLRPGGSSSSDTWLRLNGNFLVARMAWSVEYCRVRYHATRVRLPVTATLSFSLMQPPTVEIWQVRSKDLYSTQNKIWDKIIDNKARVTQYVVSTLSQIEEFRLFLPIAG